MQRLIKICMGMQIWIYQRFGLNSAEGTRKRNRHSAPISGTSSKDLLSHRNLKTYPAVVRKITIVIFPIQEIFHESIVIEKLFRMRKSKNLEILFMSILELPLEGVDLP